MEPSQGLVPRLGSFNAGYLTLVAGYNDSQTARQQSP